MREFALGLTREGLVSVFSQKESLTYEQFLHLIDDRKQRTLRVSVGLATNFSDIYRFLRFVQTMIDRPALASQ